MTADYAVTGRYEAVEPFPLRIDLDAPDLV